MTEIEETTENNIKKDDVFDTNPPIDPYQLFNRWFDQANATETIFPNAFTLATVSEEGQPQARTLLLRNIDDKGFIFYTNKKSRKGQAMEANPKASMLFYWKDIARQIEIEGDIKQISNEKSDFYFAQRPRNSQIGAWASNQSKPLPHRGIFDSKIDEYTKTFGGSNVPRPPFWGGYRLIPKRIEFWQIEEFRLHRRLEYKKIDNGWKHGLLYP